MATAPWRGAGAPYKNGSYTQVQARRTLDDPKPAPNPPERKKGFPDSLKQYVARAFENISDYAKEDVEAELKRIVTDAYEKDVVWTRDWASMPLPQVFLQARRDGREMDLDQVESGSKEEPISFGLATTRAPNTKSALSYGQQTPPSSSSTYDSKVDTFSHKKRKSPSQSKDNYTPSPSSADYSDKRTRFDKPKYENSRLKLNGYGVDNLKTQYSKMDMSGTSTPTSTDSGPAPVVGRCMELEKKYFRLTSEPNPDHVRPLHVLERTLELLKKKWKAENNYNYICDQFKSLRQDLTVQHIKNEFTVEVYEIHARIALEKGDLGEYNQCQTQLVSLYRLMEGAGHQMEFKAYRILYLLHTCNRSDINDVLANLTDAEKQHVAVQHALCVRAAIAHGNYHKLFRLYLEAPYMGAYLMDSFMPRERLASLAKICKAYRPDIDIAFLTEELGFESYLECINFLCDNGAKDFIDDKDSQHVKLQTVPARAVFEEAAAAAFRRVDIKGQI